MKCVIPNATPMDSMKSNNKGLTPWVRDPMGTDPVIPVSLASKG